MILEYVTLCEPKLTTVFYDFQMLSEAGIKSLYEKMNKIPGWGGEFSVKPDYVAVKDYNVYILLMEYLDLSWIELNLITAELKDDLIRENPVSLRKLKIIFESIRKNINKLHNLKFIHCDLHSGNIMINTNNLRENKIIDFGRSFNSDNDN